MVNGVSLNSFLAAAQQNPDGNVRLSSDGTDVKATNSFFRKAVNWMSGNNHQTREVFAQALADEYGPDAAQFAFDQAGGGGFLSSSRGDQLSALEVNALNLYAQVKAQELSSPGQIPNAIPNMPNTPAANPQGANGNSPSMRRNQPSIARFSPPRGRDVDPPSVNSLQRGPTTRSHAPLANRQSSMKSGIESPPSTPISPAAKELARESAIDRLGQIESSNDAVAAFNDQKADLRQDLEAAVGKFGSNEIMQRLENKANAADSEALQTTAYAQMRILDSAAENFAVTSAGFEVSAANEAHTKAKAALAAAKEGNDPVKTADMEKATADAKKILDDATQALTDAEARNIIRPESKTNDNKYGW